MKSVFMPFLLAGLAVASDPQIRSSTVTLGAGVAIPAAGYRTSVFQTGPSFSGEYEFRLQRFIAATVGVDSFLMNVTHYGRVPLPDTLEHVTFLPVGLRGVFPLAGDRAEAFAGAGGAPYWSSDDTLGRSFQKDAALLHLNGGFRVALHRGGRFRVGPVVRYYRDIGRPTQHWISVTAGFSYRFGP